MAEVVLSQVGKVYPDGLRAVTDLNLDIGDGEFLVLVGPSGCGKSTALRMVAGLEDITEGAISIGGRVVNNVPPRDRDVAMVFQSYALYPHLSVRDNIGFGLQLRKAPKAEINRRVTDAAGILGLEEQLDRKPRNLSGGQRQRVAMGRAIVREPQAFLMDEPLSNLDAKLRVQMRAEIGRLQRDLGVTTIYVTHDQVEAMTLGDRVAVMSKGLLQQVAPPQELYDRPLNIFVAGFIGSPAMNLMHATVHRGPAGLEARFGDQQLSLPDSALRDRPALGRYFDRDVIVGIRPEDMEDATLVAPDEGQVVTAPANLVEPMGSDVVVHMTLSATGAASEDLKELAASERAPVLDTPENATSIVARFNPRTTVREGEDVKVHIDTARLHYFDPDSGLAIYGDSDRTTTSGGTS